MHNSHLPICILTLRQLSHHDFVSNSSHHAVLLEGIEQQKSLDSVYVSQQYSC